MAKNDLFSIEWDGLEEVKQALDQWEADAIQALVRAMDENGEDLLQKSQALAPKLDADLEGSGTKDPVKVDAGGREISVEVGYNMVYAARRHEEDYTPGPISASKPGVDGMKAGPKYLERPLMFYARKWMQNMADAIKSTTGGG